MNNTALTSNGDSLGDCRTNVFPLADARGLHWKKFVAVYCPNSARVSDDPVLCAYSNALHQGILCSWQSSVVSNTVKVEHPDNRLGWGKELILFWYGEEPKLSGVVNTSLKETECGCFEEGIPMEYQSLLFKSLHNLLERQLLEEKFFCNAGWFSKSCRKGADWETLAFSFTFFIYGESLISASVNIQKAPTYRCLSRSDLSDAISSDGVQVVLAPAGLTAILTGQSLMSSNAKAARIIHEWEKFYPVKPDEKLNGILPCLVEIIHEDTKMLYPSSLVGVPICKPGKKMSDQTRQRIVKEERTAFHSSTCAFSSGKTSLHTRNLVNKIWDKIESETDGKKPTAPSSTANTESGNVFGPNKPLWDFKDRTRSAGCGCTSTTNVNRTKPVARFGSNISNLRNASTNVASPSANTHGANQPASVNQRARKERKKSALPFHQRRATTTERSPTPPLGLVTNLKGSGRVSAPLASIENEMDMKLHEHPVLKQIPHIPNIPTDSCCHVERHPDHMQRHPDHMQQYPDHMQRLPQMSFSGSVNHHVKSQSNKSSSYQYPNCVEAKTKPNYVLPVDPIPRRPCLSTDLLEARDLSTDSSYTSLYSVPVNIENDITEVVSPTTLTSPLAKLGEGSHDAEVKIVKMPNKGMKRTTEQVNDGLKKARLSSGGNQNHQNLTEPPTDPSRSHQDLQIPSPMQQSPYSQAHPPLPTQNQHQMSAKRGPGRPKRQSTSSNSSLVSPSADSNMYDNDPIISPPSVERRRKSSTPTAKTRDTLASPPPISNIKAGTVKSRRRPSKKDQHPTDPDMMPMMSPSGRGNPVALSPLSHLPSPARTPGSISSVSFTHSKDLTVNISDLDKLFGGSDDDEDELSAKVGALPDHYPSTRVSNNDDVFHTIMPPPVTSTALPHDLAQMFPTPPSQEPQIHAASPATSTAGDYINPASAAMCHAVMSPEKQVAVCEKKYEEDVKIEIAEGLEAPFAIPELQMHPVGDLFSPINNLPSTKLKPLKGQSNLPQYAPSWERKYKSPRTINDLVPNLIKIPSFESPKLIPEKLLTMQAPLPQMPNLTASCKDVSRGLEQEIMVQPLVDGIGTEVKVDMEAIESLALVLRCSESLCDADKATELVSPYQAFFKDDKSLPYDSQYCDAKKSPKDSRPKRPNDLALNTSNEASVSKTKETPTRILELFKEQWLSPFSTLYLTKVVSKFYGLNKFDTIKAMKISPNLVLELLFDLNPRIQNAFKKSLRRRAWDINKIAGPTSFQDLHRYAGKTTQISNLPVQPLLTGSDGDIVSVAPNALRFWKKLLLEPFSGPRDVAYVVVAPDSDLVLENTKQFFKALSGLYESMSLGKHCPITRVLREGIIRVGQKVMQKLSQEPVDGWFSQDDSPETARMKLIAQVCKCHLGPHLASLQLNRTLFEKSHVEERNTSSENGKLRAPGTLANAMTGLKGVSSLGMANDDADANSLNGELPAIVVYMIDPFEISGISESKEKMWSFNGLLRAFAEMTSSFSEALKTNVYLQVIPLESILQIKANTRFHNGSGLERQDTQHLAFSVYSSCRMTINSMNSGKICTSFGQGALRDRLAKKRQEDNQFPTRIYLPPCVLAPQPCLIREDPHSSMDLARVINVGDYNILFCSYCLSSDQSWLLITCTDKRGLLSDTTMIKINSQNRSSRGVKSPRRLALKRLLNYIVDTVSFYFEPWRVVISRLGRPGHGEFRDLYELIHKMITVNPAKKRPSTPETCNGCRSISEDKQKSHIRSISLVAVQSEPLIKLLPVGVKKKRNLSSRIFVVPSATHHSVKRKDRRPVPTVSLPLQHHDDLLTDPVFLLSQGDDDDHFMPMLPSPAEVANSSMLASNQPDLSQPVFSPGDGIISPNLSSPHLNQYSAVSPFQPITNNALAFNVLSPSPLMPRPSSTPSFRGTVQEEFLRVSRQPLSIGYIVSGHDLASSSKAGVCPSVIKSELLLHMARNDGQISQHPLDSEHHLESHRFILEQLESLSWLTVDPATGKLKGDKTPDFRLSLSSKGPSTRTTVMKTNNSNKIEKLT